MANLLEPYALARHLGACPPRGFATFDWNGQPGFVTDFELATTLDEGGKRWIDAVPALRRLLRLRTTFVGSTVLEYLPLPRDRSPEALPGILLGKWNGATPMLVLKDVPEDSPLLDPLDNQRCARFLAACQQAGFVLLSGQALAYVPIDFADEAEYLGRFSGARRKDLRRKLRARADLEIVTRPTGHSDFDAPAFVAQLHGLYDQVYAQSEIHFDYLTRDFLAAVLRDGALGGIVFLYRHAGTLIGFNLCFVHGRRLVDKYVGFAYPQARAHNLYFVSWMHNLAYARQQGLTHYIAGWTDPQIKAYLGARFTFTRHAVYLRNPLLRALARRLGRHFESDRKVVAADG